MFTQLKKGRWNYMFLAAVASAAVAAMATFFNASTTSESMNNQANHNSEQVISGRHTQFNGSAVRFVN